MKFGWKTILGAAVVAAGAVANYLGYAQVGELIMGLGAALGLVGLRSAVGKINN